MDDPMIAALLLFVLALVYGGSTLLLTWYSRSHLGNPPGRATWILPTLAAVGVVIAIGVGMIAPSAWALAALGILAFTAVVRYRLFGGDRDGGTSNGRTVHVEGEA